MMSQQRMISRQMRMALLLLCLLGVGTALTCAVVPTLVLAQEGQLSDAPSPDDDIPLLPPTDVETEVTDPDSAPDPDPPESSPPTPGGSDFERALQSGGNESVIGSDRIEQNVARSLDDIFRYEPGVQLDRSTGRFGETSVNIRGLDGNRVLMSVDGIRSADAYTQGPVRLGRGSVDVSLLKQVEIVRGPGSLIYGEGAIGGVVAFETKDPEDYLNTFGRDFYIGMSATYSTSDASWAETPVIACRIGNFETMVAYTRRDGNDLESAGEFPTDLQRITSDYLLGKTVYHFDDHNELEFALEWRSQRVFTDLANTLADPPGSDNTFSTTPELFPAALFASRFFSQANDTNERLRYSLTHDFNDESNRLFQHARLQVYYQDSLINDARLQRFTVLAVVPPQPPNGPPRHIINNPSDNFFLQDHFGGRMILRSDVKVPFGVHHLTYGADALRTDTTRLRTGTIENQNTGNVINSTQISDPTPSKVLPDATTTRVGMFFQDRFEFESFPLAVTTGLRVNHFSATFALPDPLFDDSHGTPEEMAEWSFQPTVEISAPLREDLTGVVRYAHGYRAPPIEDAAIGFTNPLFGYSILPNLSLSSETSDSIDFGLSYANELIAAYAGGYYNHYDDYIENVSLGLDPNSGLLLFQQQNLDAQIYGVEMSGEFLLLGYFCETPGKSSSASYGDDSSAPATSRQWHGWSAFGSFTHSVGDNLRDDIPLDSIPPLFATLGLRYQAYENRWGVELISTVVHSKDRLSGSNSNQFVTPGYGLFDLLAHATVNDHIKVNVGVFNLLDKTYYQWLALRGVGADQRDLTRFAAPGISFAGTVRVEW